MVATPVARPPRGTLRRRRPVDASERSLVSPLELRRPGARLLYWAVFALLVALTLTTMLPLYWTFTGGLKSSLEIIRTPPSIWPLHPRWDNYPTAWNDLRYPLYFRNTAILAAGAWALQLFVSATAAYALSKLRPVGGNAVLFLFLSTLMVPGVAYLIPQYVNVISLPIVHWRLVGTWWGIWLPESVSAFNIFILKSFFDEIPDDLIEAARIDGANAWQVLLRIMLPLSRAALAVVTIFTLIESWKDFLWPFLVLGPSSDLQPIMVALFAQLGSQGNVALDVAVAGLAIASIPPIVLFLIFQRQILRGITLTGLTG